MGLANVLYEWDYWASQCTVGMGQAYVLCKWDKPMCSMNGTIQWAMGMGLSNVPWEWD